MGELRAEVLGAGFRLVPEEIGSSKQMSSEVCALQGVLIDQGQLAAARACAALCKLLCEEAADGSASDEQYAFSCQILHATQVPRKHVMLIYWHPDVAGYLHRSLDVAQRVGDVCAPVF